MDSLQHLAIMVTLMVAVALALVVSDAEARQEVASLFAQWTNPPSSDHELDPGFSGLVETVPPSVSKPGK